MTASIPVSIAGPFVNGVQRGVKYTQVGYIQNDTMTAENTVYGSKTRHASNEGIKAVDYNNIPGEVGPWMDDTGQRPNAYIEANTDPVTADPVTYQMMADDTPNNIMTDLGTLNTLGVINGAEPTPTNLIDNFSLYLAVATTDLQSNANQVFTWIATTRWTFNGSGMIVNDNAWLPIPGTSGTTNIPFVTPGIPGAVVPITTGTPANVTYRGHKWSTT